MEKSFKELYSLEKRKSIYQELCKYDKIPVAFEKSPNSILPSLGRESLCLASREDLAFILFHHLKEKLKVNQEDSLFLMINNKVAITYNQVLEDVYNKFKDPEDGFLYITYDLEKTWG